MDKGILGAKTIKQAARLMKANVFTCPELIEATYANVDTYKELNAYVNVRNKEDSLREAEESQKRIEKSKSEKHPCYAGLRNRI
jgi:Asp-tRNA(Asn)/Glu-tRNA(Gln) amidotransferase A subunit family amidase